MNSKQTRPHHAPMLTLGDIYYILFRHKWKILILSAIGIIAALIVPLVWPRVYSSEARLLIKYVTETRMPTDPNGTSQHIVETDATGRNVINTELQIMTSQDLAQEVVTNLGVAKILGHEGSVVLAAARIHKNLIVDAPPGSDVIRITFRHQDPTAVQVILSAVIKTYLDRHARFRQPGGADDILGQEIDVLRSQLDATENALRTIKTNLNIVSFDESRKMFGDDMAKYQDELFKAETELAEHQAIVEQMSKRNQALQPVTNDVAQSGTNMMATAASTNNAGVVASTNAVAQQSSTNEMPMAANTGQVTPEKIAEYKRVCDLLNTFRSREQFLLTMYLPENSQVKDIRRQMANNEKLKKQLEDETPGLIAGPAALVMNNAAPSDPNVVSANDWNNENTRVIGLQRKVQALTNHIAYIQSRITLLDANADAIARLERTRKDQAQKFEYFRSSLDSERINLAFGPGKGSNINTIQSPSPPMLDNSRMVKAMAGLAFIGIAVGLGLAFLVELYIDHTLKRPADIESRLGVPLFLSIPYRNGNGKMRLLKEPPKTVLALRSEATGRAVILNGGKTTIGRDANSTVPIDDGSISEHHCEIFSRNGEVIVKDVGSTNGTFVDGERIVETTLKPDQRLRVGNVEFVVQSQEMIKDLVLPGKSTSVTPPWDPRHALRPFYDTLRDRLITYFEVKNLTHNPKLVALTSCGDRAGVTSTAAGLAAALSETGEGNVLLVDMNVERGAAHHFYKGHLSCGIDEALTKDKRHEARVQDHLYVVTESASEDSLPRVLPKRFNSLVSKLKASDFDYIIFDMPPMSQISITPRLARFMDMVMVVVESEKTDRDVVQRAVNMLTEAKANVGVVLNKRKQYVPKRLQQEL
jgi:uncharacterized protein involved in exopolysaccharide biosynthesis/Mrp family chromosome partitioning ATPase